MESISAGEGSLTYRPRPLHRHLGPSFFDEVEPARFPALVLRFRNQRYAQRIGLAHLTDAQWIEHFGRFVPLPDNLPVPLALRYHGHQFDHYNPELGDGRGFLFAQLLDERARLLDLGTKGSGTTPYSRRGDGRLTLKGGVREVLASEMLEALCVNTSKSFSLIETGESLERHDEPSPTRASVLVRLSHSHIRFGTFQRLAFEGDRASVERLVDYCLEYYCPELDVAMSLPARVAEWFEHVLEQTAQLCASWMAAGFVHGVLNSDNMTVTGESFDYGPYRFLPRLDPTFTAAYFDHGGLYAYGRQPRAVLRNLSRLAECLVPLAGSGVLSSILDGFDAYYERAFHQAVARRLGVKTAGADADRMLAEAVWDWLQRERVSFAQFFFDWYAGTLGRHRAASSPLSRAYATDGFRPVRSHLEETEPIHRAALEHPYFARRSPCDLLIEEVEALWAPIAERNDFTPFENKVREIREMGEALRPPSERG